MAQIESARLLGRYTNGMGNHKAGDGSRTNMHYAGSGCIDRQGYGNVDPWRVPAWPSDPVGEIPNGKTLLWRYVSRDGEWVMVRDPQPSPGRVFSVKRRRCWRR